MGIVLIRHKEDRDYEKRGKDLIDKIEAFRQKQNRLPNIVAELGLEEPMNDGPYYEKRDSVNYIVFFNIGFDNAKIYYSEFNLWKDERR